VILDGGWVPVLVGGAILVPMLLALREVVRPGPASPWLAVAPVPALLAGALLATGSGFDAPWLLFGARFGLDDTGRLLLLASAVVWLAAALHAVGDGMARGARAGFLLAMAGNFGAVLAQDAASLFTCYALMSFSAYLLVVERADAAARRAGRVYVALVVLGEVLVLSGLLFAAAGSATAVSTIPLAGLLLWIGFGIKAGLVPLHFSLPLAYGAASTGGAIALAGAMVNAGLLGWLRFLPGGDPGAADLGLAMMALGLGGAFYGVLVGLTQTDARVLLGYSSVSQMGLMAVGLGAGVAAPGSWGALVGVVVLFAVHHAFAKAALFAGLAWSEGSRSPMRHLGLLVPAAALIGLPFTSGALAKAALKGALPALPGFWAEVLAVALPLATLGTTLLMARLVFVAAGRGPVSSVSVPGMAGTALLLVAVVGGVWWLPGVVPVAAESPAGSGVLWPALAGGLIALAVYWLDRAHGLALRARIPPGDLSLPVERLAGALWRLVVATPEAHHGGGPEAPSATRRPGRLAALLTRGEAALTRWELAGIALLALAAAVAVVVFRG
jgi:formate hydrogenlyase subunit 3/multisubunit Na+/H+ antiporter MnhD subunit